MPGPVTVIIGGVVLTRQEAGDSGSLDETDTGFGQIDWPDEQED